MRGPGLTTGNISGTLSPNLLLSYYPSLLGSWYREHDLPRAIEPELSENPRVQRLFQTIFAIEDEQLLEKFLRALLSAKEIKQAANRWMVAEALLAGKRQADIVRETEVNKTTVGNIAKWVNGALSTGGFEEVYQLLQQKEVAEPE